MPPVRPVHHVPDHVVFVEKNITLDLLILLHDQVDRRGRVWPWSLPSTALPARVHDGGDAL